MKLVLPEESFLKPNIMAAVVVYLDLLLVYTNTNLGQPGFMLDSTQVASASVLCSRVRAQMQLLQRTDAEELACFVLESW